MADYLDGIGDYSNLGDSSIDFSSDSWLGDVDYLNPEEIDWSSIFDSYDGGQVDLGNSEYMMDGSPNPNYDGGLDISSYIAKILGINTGNGLIPGLADLGTHVMGLSDIYNKYDTDKDLKEMIAKSLYNTDDDYRMAFTGQATGLMDDRYNAGMNEQKLGMLYDIMMNRGDITKDQYNSRIGGLGQLTQGYEGMVAPQTNYLLDRRQDRFGDPYDPGTTPITSTGTLPIDDQPFYITDPGQYSGPNAVTGAGGTRYPAGTTPEQIAAYEAYLKGGN